MADNSEAARINLLERVLCGVPVGILDVEVNDICSGNAATNERHVIVPPTENFSFPKTWLQPRRAVVAQIRSLSQG